MDDFPDLIDADGFFDLLRAAAGAGTAIIVNVGVQRLLGADTSLFTRIAAATGVGLVGGVVAYRFSHSFAAGFAGSLIGLGLLAIFTASAVGTPLTSVHPVLSLEPRDIIEVDGEYVT